jgi:hypothetical protein
MTFLVIFILLPNGSAVVVEMSPAIGLGFLMSYGIVWSCIRYNLEKNERGISTP